jgi:outer membrane protein assembly factor BamD
MQNVLKDYPATKYREQAMFYILKAEYSYAAGSIDSKKKERFAQATKAFNTFKSQYPQSAYLREAETINQKITLQLSKLN